jgi:hypothetical protein
MVDDEPNATQENDSEREESEYALLQGNIQVEVVAITKIKIREQPDVLRIETGKTS